MQTRIGKGEGSYEEEVSIIIQKEQGDELQCLVSM